MSRHSFVLALPNLAALWRLYPRRGWPLAVERFLRKHSFVITMKRHHLVAQTVHIGGRLRPFWIYRDIAIGYCEQLPFSLSYRHCVARRCL